MAINTADLYNLAMRPPLSGRSRQRTTILGVGGVGSNLVREMLDPIKQVYSAFIYDDDQVELHNLNRTSMFSLDQAMSKSFKVFSIISNQGNFMRANSIDVEMVASKKSSVKKINRENFTEIPLNQRILIDARDTMAPSMVIPKTWIKLAYDGGSDISFTFLPDIIADKIFDLTAGRTNSYAVTPSFYVPAAVLSIMTLRFMQFYNFLEITDLRAGTFQTNIDDLITAVSYQLEGAEDLE